VSAIPKAIGPTLTDGAGANTIIVLNSGPVDMALAENSAVFTPAGTGPPVLITQAERGYQGKVSGRLASIGSFTAAQQKAAFLNLIKNNGQTLYLSIVDDAFQCFIYNATYKPVAKNEEVVYDISFDFAQTDYVP
jgi:hypothetical protein